MNASLRNKIQSTLENLEQQLQDGIESYRLEYQELAADDCTELTDTAVKTYSLEHVCTRLENEERRLQRTRSAIRRLATGHYGFCVKCANPISEARLEAQPDALLCIECASARDRGLRMRHRL
ncbi:MAG: TraR/DksA family transcriptional regulator [Spirochaetales bacterium]